ncbi:hypothetical protein [Ornithinibacillus halophilus]|uniref:Uncharacterized protein n=1 Tax=Ornithinibacillus halophilus TaxID=930117 RepID=A0A1M5I4P5_9BACI|nr:hypothetical protein [Ornithinibacillus halophilus]SHG23304.1 hypothetical protein SAMN05216225_102156 [Ornithinibacillus halophilus]
MSQLDKNQTYTLDEFLIYAKEEERAELYEGTPVFWHQNHLNMRMS